MRKYPVIFKDKRGTEKSEFHSNGSNLKIKLRGIEFEGSCFESLEGAIDKEKFEYEEYEEWEKIGDLTNCNLQVEIPIKIIRNKQESEEILHVEIILNRNDHADSEVWLLLMVDGNSYRTLKKHWSVEDALVEIQDHLPEEIKIKTCLSCKFSHYSPYGSGMFGYLYCFRNLKEETPAIKDKQSLFGVWSKESPDNSIFDVQETFDCEEHEFITSNDWNYSNWKT